jgi:hypothetical protein
MGASSLLLSPKNGLILIFQHGFYILLASALEMKRLSFELGGL